MITIGNKKINLLASIIIFSVMSVSNITTASAQSNSYMRIAKIVVDSTQLDSYVIALKEQMKTALKNEKGVLAYSAVQDKTNPACITILETYASVVAYQKHTQAPHFKKYKSTVENMVKSLELIEVQPIAIGDKKKVILY